MGAERPPCKKGIIMFCPHCGGFLWDELFGGRCMRRCRNCEKAYDCWNIYTHYFEYVAVKSPFKAIYLRIKYIFGRK